jgi:hypothetical protein
MSALLDLDQKCLEYIAVTRLSFLFQRIPSPLRPIRGILIAGLTAFIPTAHRFLATLFPDIPPSANTLSYDPQHAKTATSSSSSIHSPHNLYQVPVTAITEVDPRFPAYVAMCAPLAILALRGAAVHIRSMGGSADMSVLLHLPRLRRAEIHLRGLGGNGEEMLRQADEAFGTLEEEAQRTEQVSFGSLAGPGAGPEGPAPWDPGADLMMGTALFDFDLFSWDPTLLTPDWNTMPNGGGHT